MQIGLQLYTVKADAAQDLESVLREVARIGYQGVEFAGLYGHAPQTVRIWLDDTGLAVAGSVHGMQELESNLSGAMAVCHQLGAPALVFPWLGEERRRTADDWKRIAALFNRVGQDCRAASLRFLYHIHGYEFATYEGQTGLEWLMQETDPALVALELDTYWVAHGGADPLEIFHRYETRCPYLHLKDARDRESWHDIEPGDGVLDISRLLREAPCVEWAIVEQERFDRPALESIRIGFDNVRRLLSVSEEPS